MKRTGRPADAYTVPGGTVRSQLLILGLLLSSSAHAGKKKGADPPTPVQSVSQTMTQDQLDQIIRRVGTEVVRADAGHAWEFNVKGVRLLCVTDTRADRMRFIAPIAMLDQLPAATAQVLLQANFHTALDARYAVSEGAVYGTFLHPLSSLTVEDAVSAMNQVASLYLTFGTTFTSTEMVFGSPQ